MRIRRLWVVSLLLWVGACGHGTRRPPEEPDMGWGKGVRTKGGDSATARIPVLMARGEYAEAEVLIAEALKTGLLAGAQAERLRQQVRQAQEQHTGTRRPPPPVSPPWPEGDDTPDDGRSCAKVFPEYPLCQQLPDKYGFPNSSAALEAMKRRLGQKGLRLHNPDPTREGPCENLGGHYNVRLNGERVGSIVCCPCCVETAQGAIERERCGIVW